jgi:predicted metal-dependent hydrolase
VARAIDPSGWETCSLYLRGVDLFNHAYFWESHEAFEALWRGSPEGSAAADLLQGLIQVAASEIKRFSAMPDAARTLAERALARLVRVPSPYLGIDVRAFEHDVAARISGERLEQPVLVLV